MTILNMRATEQAKSTSPTQFPPMSYQRCVLNIPDELVVAPFLATAYYGLNLSDKKLGIEHSPPKGACHGNRSKTTR